MPINIDFGNPSQILDLLGQAAQGYMQQAQLNQQRALARAGRSAAESAGMGARDCAGISNRRQRQEGVANQNDAIANKLGYFGQRPAKPASR